MSEIKFKEKQYLGLNKMSLSRRIALALFCFVAYYWKENHEKSGELFFFLGIAILVIATYGRGIWESVLHSQPNANNLIIEEKIIKIHLSIYKLEK